MTDQTELLKQLRDLEPQVISAIHERYFPELFRYARYRLGDAVQAEDVASDVFVRLLEAIDQGRGPRHNLRGWLFQTTANVVNDAFRNRYRHPKEPLADTLQSPTAGPARLLADLEWKSDLRDAIGTLTLEQQHVISLRFGAGLSLKETAEAMGKRINAVKSLQFRAVRALRDQLSVGADR
ncbi:MAG: sigma-70 family RNA polymerase sigma factor [Anaerolineales bacterium]